MPHTLDAPPVSQFSMPGEISAWIDELRQWRTSPRFADAESRERLERALGKAERWLVQARGWAADGYYVLIDPPVSAFSPPDEIRAWIQELRSRATREEFQYPVGQRCLDGALREAEDALRFSQRHYADWVKAERTFGCDDAEPDAPA
ncbi:hypothetical protein [Longimicrobium sp.]|uniref:hypothetical protein n=1 Tax=Longimicrobium sp. TaxID=2029185 RepID=UPI002CB6C348|nr:hypothetical protein [Longimicrobium sp.]HSU15267.1 hypothetical protein [Longimicrobium sp.]